jgi:hypothetical protein
LAEVQREAQIQAQQSQGIRHSPTYSSSDVDHGSDSSVHKSRIKAGISFGVWTMRSRAMAANEKSTKKIELPLLPLPLSPVIFQADIL